jgi:hypothetical protein
VCRDEHFTLDARVSLEMNALTKCFYCAPTVMSALQVALRYRHLMAVEDAFKTAKALLATCPIFHETDAAIRGQVFAVSSQWCCACA